MKRAFIIADDTNLHLAGVARKLGCEALFPLNEFLQFQAEQGGTSDAASESDRSVDAAMKNIRLFLLLYDVHSKVSYDKIAKFYSFFTNSSQEGQEESVVTGMLVGLDFSRLNLQRSRDCSGQSEWQQQVKSLALEMEAIHRVYQLDPNDFELQNLQRLMTSHIAANVLAQQTVAELQAYEADRQGRPLRYSFLARFTSPQKIAAAQALRAYLTSRTPIYFHNLLQHRPALMDRSRSSALRSIFARQADRDEAANPKRWIENERRWIAQEFSAPAAR